MTPENNHDVFTLLPCGCVSLDGVLGEAIGKSIAARLKKVSYAHLVDPFRMRDEDDGLWRCEFWGKIVRSAIRSWRARPDEELRACIVTTVRDMLSTQTEDGCISSYPEAVQATRWDIWGRKYVILALCRYCNVIDNDPSVREAIARCLDHLMAQVGPNGKNMLATGEHLGMASSSILGAVIQAYRLLGDARLMDYANWIVKEGGSPVFAQVMRAESPSQITNGKAYEMTSCVEGLLELYRENGDTALLDAAHEYFAKVRAEEIFVTGVGGLKDSVGEFWYQGAINQVRQDCGGLGETCVTTTYIRFCLNLLRATGDVRVADEIERSLYNGALGAMTPDGSWWMHVNPTPLSGASSKKCAPDQIFLCSKGKFSYNEDCCLAQGPEAIATAALFAVMRCADGIVINLYEPCKTKIDDALSIDICGAYPDAENVNICVHCRTPRTFVFKLRIPYWSETTRVRVAGADIQTQAGTYCEIQREWQEGDTIELFFSMPLTVIQIPGGYRALRRGPVLLARDSRLGDVDSPYKVPGKLRAAGPYPGIRRVYALDDGSLVCDYASAGNTFDDTSQLRVFC